MFVGASAEVAPDKPKIPVIFKFRSGDTHNQFVFCRRGDVFQINAHVAKRDAVVHGNRFCRQFALRKNFAVGR